MKYLVVALLVSAASAFTTPPLTFAVSKKAPAKKAKAAATKAVKKAAKVVKKAATKPVKKAAATKPVKKAAAVVKKAVKEVKKAAPKPKPVKKTAPVPVQPKVVAKVRYSKLGSMNRLQQISLFSVTIFQYS